MQATSPTIRELRRSPAENPRSVQSDLREFSRRQSLQPGAPSAAWSPLSAGPSSMRHGLSSADDEVTTYQKNIFSNYLKWHFEFPFCSRKPREGPRCFSPCSGPRAANRLRGDIQDEDAASRASAADDGRARAKMCSKHSSSKVRDHRFATSGATQRRRAYPPRNGCCRPAVAFDAGADGLRAIGRKKKTACVEHLPFGMSVQLGQGLSLKSPTSCIGMRIAGRVPR